MATSKKKKIETSNPKIDQIVDKPENPELFDNDTSDIDFLGKAIAIILIIINIAWLIVITPAIYNTLFPKF